MERYDAVVVGSGPNGLAAAVAAARQGLSVLVLEGSNAIGGGTRSQELTLPGFVHDVCSAVHPLGIASPFLASLPLGEHGLSWIQPERPLAHPVTPDRAAVIYRDLDRTVEGLGEDGPAYRRTVERLIRWWPAVIEHVLGPLLRLPRHPLQLLGFGLEAIQPASWAARRFTTDEARGLFAGCAAHSFLPLHRPLTSSFGWVLLAGAHAVGWPIARGGSQSIADALASYLRSLGGEIHTGHMVTTLDELPPHRLTFLDLTPGGFARLASDRLPQGYLRRVGRFRHGPAAFKLDYALDGPVPWVNEELRTAGTIHLGGTFEEVASAERAAWRGHTHSRPFVLVSQPSSLDPSRAPEGRHSLWVYAHVPRGSVTDHTQAVEDQIERFAPGFSERVLARHVIAPPAWQDHNPNYVDGDITGGAHTVRQLVFRPFPQRDPYATPLHGVYLCSSSTPPGAGVHGMCGYWAVRSALRSR